MAVRDCNPYSYWCLVCFHILLYCDYILILALCFFAKSTMICTLWKAFQLCWSHDGQDTITILWVKHGIMCGIKGWRFILCYLDVNWILGLRRCPHSHWLVNRAYKQYHSNENLPAFYLYIRSCVAKRWRWLGEEMYGAWSWGFKTKGKTKEDLERGCTWGLSST